MNATMFVSVRRYDGVYEPVAAPFSSFLVSLSIAMRRASRCHVAKLRNGRTSSAERFALGSCWMNRLPSGRLRFPSCSLYSCNCA